MALPGPAGGAGQLGGVTDVPASAAVVERGGAPLAAVERIAVAVAEVGETGGISALTAAARAADDVLRRARVRARSAVIRVVARIRLAAVVIIPVAILVRGRAHGETARDAYVIDVLRRDGPCAMQDGARLRRRARRDEDLNVVRLPAGH